MKPRLESLVVLAKPEDTIAATVHRMATAQVAFFGLSVVLDDESRVLGVLNSGDILRLLAAETDLSRPIKTVMIRDPITVKPNLTPDEIISDVFRQIRATRRLTRETIAHVLVADEHGRLANVIGFAELVARQGRHPENVAVFGLGYVGITLAATLANRGYHVTGIDVEPELVARLKKCDVHVHEPGLEDMVRAGTERGALAFSTKPGDQHYGVSVIAVGTPIDGEGTADLSSVEAVTRAIGANLKRGDLVMLRSTVPVGTTRKFVRPLLEQVSGLGAGEDFHLAFTPERTIEGKAMRELRELPQIVGGLTPACTQRAAAFWSPLTNSIVHMDNVEAAELVKLANNSFRDLSFGFSNALAMVADRYNVDAFRLVLAANEGYPRNTIPLPSPGVGGYCLTKDPFLYASAATELVHAGLVRAGREANRSAAKYPVEALNRYLARASRSFDGLRVLVIGVAFKGLPETNDTRGSTAIEVGRALQDRGARVSAWDAVVPRAEIERLGFEFAEPLDAAANVDAMLILNNHTDNTPPGLLTKCRRPMFLFDGWSLLDAREVERHQHMTYATMGYMTPQT